MKIDFERFPLVRGIGKSVVEPMNVKAVFADELYTRGQGIAFGALALKIYNSEGETDYTDAECRLMVAFSEQCMAPNFIDSLKMVVGGNGNTNTNT